MVDGDPQSSIGQVGFAGKGIAGAGMVFVGVIVTLGDGASGFAGVVGAVELDKVDKVIIGALTGGLADEEAVAGPANGTLVVMIDGTVAGAVAGAIASTLAGTLAAIVGVTAPISAAFLLSSSFCFFFLNAKSFRDIFTLVGGC